MTHQNTAKHWETIYRKKSPKEMSWTQQKPVSLEFIQELNLTPAAKIIDVGGGNSNLVDDLLEMKYAVEVLDISGEALAKSKSRLNEKADQVQWIHQNILDFHPNKKYEVWHDRAAFHFLTNADEIEAYLKVVQQAHPRYLIIGTFSKSGPEKCSGLPVKQYNQQELVEVFNSDFELIKAIEKTHVTPFETNQDFIFGIFKSRSS